MTEQTENQIELSGIRNILHFYGLTKSSKIYNLRQIAWKYLIGNDND